MSTLAQTCSRKRLKTCSRNQMKEHRLNCNFSCTDCVQYLYISVWSVRLQSVLYTEGNPKILLFSAQEKASPSATGITVGALETTLESINLQLPCFTREGAHHPPAAPPLSSPRLNFLHKPLLLVDHHSIPPG